jgi:hypothetical protein
MGKGGSPIPLTARLGGTLTLAPPESASRARGRDGELPLEALSSRVRLALRTDGTSRVTLGGRVDGSRRGRRPLD